MKSARRTNNRSSYAASPNAWIGWPARSQSEKAKKATIHRFAAVRAVRPCKRDKGMVVRSILAFRKLAAAPARRATRARGSRRKLSREAHAGLSPRDPDSARSLPMRAASAGPGDRAMNGTSAPPASRPATKYGLAREGAQESSKSKIRDEAASRRTDAPRTKKLIDRTTRLRTSLVPCQSATAEAARNIPVEPT